MQSFHCDHCQQLVFFENVKCLNCGHTLAYLPDLGLVSSLEPVGRDEWRSPLARSQSTSYRLCQNYAQESVCNWAIPAADPSALCTSCRLTRVIPDLTHPETRRRGIAWRSRNGGSCIHCWAWGFR